MSLTVLFIGASPQFGLSQSGMAADGKRRLTISQAFSVLGFLNSTKPAPACGNPAAARTQEIRFCLTWDDQIQAARRGAPRDQFVAPLPQPDDIYGRQIRDGPRQRTAPGSGSVIRLPAPPAPGKRRAALVRRNI